MEFEPVSGSGAFLIRPTVHQDHRGAFSRVWCADEFAKAGLKFEPVQANTSLTLGVGSLRGMHFQRKPFAEAKLVRCSRGRVYDVIVDLRAGSDTQNRWFAFELSEEGHEMLYVPEGFAHGFQVMTAEARIEYMMGQVYSAAESDGFRWDDPEIGIQWPLPPTRMSERDLAWPSIRGRAQ